MATRLPGARRGRLQPDGARRVATQDLARADRRGRHQARQDLFSQTEDQLTSDEQEVPFSSLLKKKMSTSILKHLCEVGARFYNRGYAFGSTGNLSVRIGDQIWITPTGQPLKGLTPEQLAGVDLDGKSFNENRPSKELPFHLGVYRTRIDAEAIVHLHSTYSVALSCLESLDLEQPLPPITPYYFMRVAPLAVLPYFRPGSAELASTVEEAAQSHNCMLFRNHGMTCLGSSMNEAVDRAEELEQTARLYFLLRGEHVHHLTGDEIEDLQRVFR